MADSTSLSPPSWEFHLPLSPTDLLRSAGSLQYVVQEVLPLRQLPAQLAVFQTTFRTQGALAVLQHFDTLFSILHYFRTVDSAVKEDALELMMKVVTSQSNALTAILNDSDLRSSLRVLHLNALKMNCYILVQLVEAFETESGKTNLVGLESKGKNKKSHTKGFAWEEERQSIIQLLTQLLQLDLHQLWNGLVVEEEFVSLVTGCCYRILENPTISHQRHRPTRDTVIHLLGVALSRYDHMLSATLKVTQMLQHFEHVASVFVEAITVWIKDYGMKSIVGEILREIGQKCPQELAREASGMKGYAAFLTELSERTPAIVLSNMSVLLHHLDGESYGMRNAILAAMAEMLLQVLNGEQLEEAARNTRDQFLDTLQAHTCDISSFVRSQAVISPEEEWEAMQPELQATLKNSEQWEEEGHDLETSDPAQLINDIVQLLRKSNYKNAICLTREGMHQFQGLQPFSNSPGTKDDEKNFILNVLRTLYLDTKITVGVQESTDDDNSTGNEKQTEEDPLPAALVKQEMLVQYLQDAYNFSAKITEALSMVSKLMYERSVSVAQEAIEFFVIVSQFGVPQAVFGVRRMLPLIWSKEPGVREAVTQAQNLIHSLSLLIVDASLGTIKCLEEIISEFVQKDEIKPIVIQLLWEQFTEKLQCSKLERRAAIMLLGMMAQDFSALNRGKPEIVGSNLDLLISVGLDERVQEDYHLAQEVCNAISKIAKSQKSDLGKNTTPFRLPQSHLLFKRLHEVITVGFTHSSAHWIPFTERAIALIYLLAEGPEEICAQTLQSCSQQALEKLQEFSTAAEAEFGSSSNEATGDSNMIDIILLTHLVSLAGDVALQQLVHLELSISNELRRRRVLGEERDTKEQASSTVKVQNSKCTGNDTTMEEDLGLVGASAEDTEMELIRTICETELLDGKQLLSAFVPLVVKICNNPGLYSDPALSAAAALALGKFCMISTEFCDSHLRLFFTMMEKATLSSVRANLIIAAGDLAIRFPNLVEPWTPHLYARLRDPCPHVRRTTAMVMTHLILKDMVKVKGQVSEMAALLIDPEDEIVQLARNFFTELSNKDNAVYNLLPDIISRLSDADSGIEEQPFHTIMRLLFSFITKDKQTESLVEKLCQRFRTARTERQHHDLAYCLTLLPLTERGLRKMQDNFDCFADKLQDLTVYNHFLVVLGRVRRVATKAEMKALIEEFEQKLQKCHNKGLDSFTEAPQETAHQEGSNIPVLQSIKKVVSRSCRRPLRAGNRKTDSAFITPNPHITRSKRKSYKHKISIVFSSDEENSLDEELDAELTAEETPSKTTPISRSSHRSR
ncbi:Condensin complex subunit 1, partial [Ophiophagus hannah]